MGIVGEMIGGIHPTLRIGLRDAYCVLRGMAFAMRLWIPACAGMTKGAGMTDVNVECRSEKGKEGKSMAKGKNVFTTGEVAEVCNVAARTVSKWFDRKLLGGYRIPGSKDRRIPVAELVAFMKKYEIPGHEQLSHEFPDAGKGQPKS